MTHDWNKRARFVAASIFFLAAAFVFAKTGRDALFVQGRGVFDLPKAYIGIAAVSGPLAFSVLFFLKRYGPRLVRLWLPVFAAITLFALSGFVHSGGGTVMTLFFMFVPLVWGVIFSVSWLLASDLLEGAPPDAAARGFSRIGGAAIVGGVVAAAVASLVAPRMEPAFFLWFAAIGLLIAAGIMATAQRRYPPNIVSLQPRPDGDGSTNDRSILGSRYTRALLTVGMLAALVGVLVEFQFYVAASLAGGAARDKAALFANFYLWLNMAALMAQIWILPRLLRRVGIGGALLVLPMALVGGATGLAASGSLFVASAVRVTEGGLKSSIHRASWEQTFLSLEQHSRTRAKILVDGMAVRFAEGLAALVVLLWLRLVVGDSDLGTHSTAWMTLLLLMGALGWVVATRRLACEIRARARGPSSTTYQPVAPPNS